MNNLGLLKQFRPKFHSTQKACALGFLRSNIILFQAPAAKILNPIGAFSTRAVAEGETYESPSLAEGTRLKAVRLQEKEIRVSPWKLNLVAAQVRRLTLPEAYAQTMFSKKHQAKTVERTLQRAAKILQEQSGILPEELMVKEAFATPGTQLKRIKIMGRGYHGIMHRKYAHLTVCLEQIDFDQKIEEAQKLGGRFKVRKWEKLAERAKKAKEESISDRSSSGTENSTNLET
mmetsp:Transcript_41340/g.54345  ORF Transcript_41340/g.54345 Transcript_41340/m.54345 type:complete len:232 (-) Transcript_41340:244-939(-)|eukprot:CAMPEP_0117757332 /NCGR_PEP_ID=MMETSP0947-20121206/14664_1 /TAXON_ID=44440 /ORGANISM="Chattonella subsalsa, Strain CCMP2191" /LENGTH=231 /DNA_ID=CAMNT_0005577197 /DNA_START=57 /DNA_END=752 /DNA_ORIENTATION=-